MIISALRLKYSEEEIFEIKQSVEEVLRNGYLTMGKKVSEFERLFRRFISCKYAVAVNSGTSALEIILRVIDVRRENVIIPSNTMMATPTSVIHAGGKIIFADCDKDNLQLDPIDLENKLKKYKAKAVIIVHIGGIISPDLEIIKELCKKYGVYLIEDAAHAHGATIDGKFAGTLGLAGGFSFYPTKVFTTAEGGIITTDNEVVYKKAYSLRDYARDEKDPNMQVDIAHNWRFSEIHAILGIQQMDKAKEILMDRREIANWYDNKLDGIKGIRKLEIPDNIKSSYYKYIVFLDDTIDRTMIKQRLQKEYNITLPSEVYSIPCHKQLAILKYPEYVVNEYSDNFPNTEYISNHHICFPIYPSLTEMEVDYVVGSLRKILK